MSTTAQVLAFDSTQADATTLYLMSATLKATNK